MFNKILAIKNLITGKFAITHGSSEVELQKTDFGIVYCETAMMERLAARVATKVKAIHKANVIIDKPTGNFPLRVQFTMVIKQAYSANEVSATLVDEVKKVLNYTCGIENVTVDVRITDVEKTEQKRRVK